MDVYTVTLQPFILMAFLLVINSAISELNIKTNFLVQGHFRCSL